VGLAYSISKQESDIEVTKRQWGAFYGTDLELQLRRRGIDTIILCGIATNIGVESTARNAWELGFNLVIVEDACSAASTGQHQGSMTHIFPRIARVRSTETFSPPYDLYRAPQWSHPKWARLGITSLEDYARHFNCVTR
jgi:nicotinamidase-related amidase